MYVGVDGSLAARAAVAWAAERAVSVGAELVLVHVVDDEWGAIGLSALRELAETGASCLDRESELARTSLRVQRMRTLLLEGNPMLELATLSEHASLVVVGTQKGGFIRGRHFGSRGLQLAAATRSPIAVIPQSPLKERHGVTVGVEPYHPVAAALTFAVHEAVRLRQQLILLQAGASADDLASQAMAAALLADAESAVMRPHLRRADMGAAEALADATLVSSLVVTGRPTRPGSDRGLGHVNHDLLANLAGPVVVVPER